MNGRSVVTAVALSSSLLVAACARETDGTITFEIATPEEEQRALAAASVPPIASPSTSTALPATAAPSVAVSTPTTAAPTAATGLSATPSTTPLDRPGRTTPPTTDAQRGTSSDCLAELSVRQRVALLVWPSAYSDRWQEAVESVSELGLGGVLLMKPGDGVDLAELTDLIAQLDRASELGVLVSTDEEGGNVQRLRAYGSLPSQADVAANVTPDEAAALIRGHADLIGRIGVDVVLGPVVDVLPEDGESALDPTRFFGERPDVVQLYAEAYVDGWQSAGLLPVLKHFPGHGAADTDSHLGAAVTPPLEELQARDLRPYTWLATRSPQVAVMMGHLTVPGLTDGLPASLSANAVVFLRETLGFGDSLVMTDALEMGAVPLPLADAAVAAVVAGVDVVIFTASAAAAEVVGALESAVLSGDLSIDRVDEAAGRVLRLLAESGRGCAS